MKAYIETYGCALNEADSKIIQGILEREGVEIVDNPENADIIFLNTCAVKHRTENRMLSRIRELNPEKLVVCGCLPKINPEAIKKASSCVMLDTNSLNRIPELLKEKKSFFSENHLNKLDLPFSKQGLVATVPIAEGCLGNCSFCATKNARGRLTSYPVKDVVRTVEKSLEEGAKEVRLTAEDTGVYGWDTGTSLHSLLKEVTEINKDFKVRVGMMEPFSALKNLDELVKVFENPKIYDFAHIPVQSGSDKVLNAMQRKYLVEDFKKIAGAFKKKPFFNLATDVIVGFPGETKEDFKKTLDLMKEIKPGVTNVSMFYPRPNTKAKLLKKIPTQTLKKRSRECSALSNKISLKENQLLLGNSFKTLVLEEGRKGGFVGRLPNYTQVVLGKAIIGREYEVKIKKAFSNYVTA